MFITKSSIQHLLNSYKCDIQFDICDLDYLDEYLKDADIQYEFSLIDLGVLYNRFSEEVWSASWEDNAEGQFIEWLKSNTNNAI